LKPNPIPIPPRAALSKIHPWELAWREGRWEEKSPPLAEVVEFVSELKHANAKTILDLGCGAGRHSILLAKEGFQVAALDVSETALKTLDTRLKAGSVGNVVLIQHEMGELPFIEDYFDGVVSTNVLHHGKSFEIKKTIDELYRVMKPGASAFIIALSSSDFRKGTGAKLERNTYVFTKGEERGIIHHFFTRQELQSFLRKFETVSFNERLIPIDQGGNRAHFLVKLRKG
jgi:ubiquinone/menaquinone biosynthesis C-methylase UbiE